MNVLRKTPNSLLCLRLSAFFVDEPPVIVEENHPDPQLGLLTMKEIIVGKIKSVSLLSDGNNPSYSPLEEKRKQVLKQNVHGVPLPRCWTHRKRLH